MTQAWDELVATMDRLRSPGGCPWDAEQTHESLVRYLLEEAHELAEAIETGDREGLREELGDVLLQVVFHARVAAEHASDPFDADDVARDLTAKLVRRHPHVFAGTEVADLDVQWDALKAREKRRGSVLDGIPAGLGALASAQKVRGRLRRAGLLEEAEERAQDDARAADGGTGVGVPAADGGTGAGVPAADEGPRADVPALSRGARADVPAVSRGTEAPAVSRGTEVPAGADAHSESQESLAARLAALVAEADAADVDLESLLRTRTTRLAHAARTIEADLGEERQV